MDERWYDAHFEQVPDEELSTLQREACDELEKHLEANPTAAETARAVLEYGVGQPIESESWRRSADALAAVVGEASPHLLTWVARGDPVTERLDELVPYASPRTIAVLRELVGLYGHYLRDSFMQQTENRDDWRFVLMSVSEQLLTGSYEVRATITKVDGTTMVLEGPPDSFLSLVMQIARSLSSLGGREGAFGTTALEQVREAVRDLEAAVGSAGSGPEAGRDDDVALVARQVPTPQ